MSASFLEHFVPLQPPRVERNQRHALLDIVLLVVCAVTRGADGREAVEEFGREKLDWLRKFASFANGISSPGGIANVVARLTSKGFGECFRSWTQAVAETRGGPVVALDGKSARGSCDRRRGRSALPMMVERHCPVETVERRYFINSIPAQTTRFASSVRHPTPRSIPGKVRCERAALASAGCAHGRHRRVRQLLWPRTGPGRSG